jgi:hypothetical protein
MRLAAPEAGTNFNGIMPSESLLLKPFVVLFNSFIVKLNNAVSHRGSFNHFQIGKTFFEVFNLFLHNSKLLPRCFI